MDGNPKQVIVERIKGVTNILVTVSRNPSVDELSAALALTLMLNKMDKHATAVFSGAIPPAISFLEPARTFENTVDSLRDFIIALDKEKADRLRYKVEDDVVRIFITPYRTTITQNDLQFSQGDFNVELIIALGVDRREDLDGAIAAHGRILHDATVATINANNDTSSLGSIDWSDGGASSLCEMLMSLSEALQSGLLDQQIATALLTGIVAATDRFSNTRTTPKIMTMSAQLMAAGANQQLISARLESAQVVSSAQPRNNGAAATPQKMREGSSAKVGANGAPVKPDGEMHVNHEDIPASVPPQAIAPPMVPPQSPDYSLPPPQAPPLPPRPERSDLPRTDGAPDVPEPPKPDGPSIGRAKSTGWLDGSSQPPSMGGTLNATAGEAEEARRAEELDKRNHKLLSHDTPASEKGSDASSISASDPLPYQPQPAPDPFATPFSYEETPLAKPGRDTTAALDDIVKTNQTSGAAGNNTDYTRDHLTIEQVEQRAREISQDTPALKNSLESARSEVEAALQSSAPAPDPLAAVPPPVSQPSAAPQPPTTPFDGALPPPPPMPDFSTLPPLPANPPVQPTPQVSEPSPPPMFPAQPPTDFSQAPAPNAPGQFRIPGQ